VQDAVGFQINDFFNERHVAGTCDDDRAILDVITEILTLDGNEVIVAEDGIQGLEQFKNQLPDLVITDLEMPRMDGIELIESLTAQFGDVPFIVITGSSDMSLIEEVIDLEANRVLHKPFEVDMLLDAVSLLTGKLSHLPDEDA